MWGEGVLPGGRSRGAARGGLWAPALSAGGAHPQPGSHTGTPGGWLLLHNRSPLPQARLQDVARGQQPEPRVSPNSSLISAECCCLTRLAGHRVCPGHPLPPQARPPLASAHWAGEGLPGRALRLPQGTGLCQPSQTQQQNSGTLIFCRPAIRTRHRADGSSHSTSALRPALGDWTAVGWDHPEASSHPGCQGWDDWETGLTWKREDTDQILLPVRGLDGATHAAHHPLRTCNLWALLESLQVPE